MTELKPTKFEDLTPTELYRSGVEDFALDIDQTDKNKKRILLAAFLEGGVEWNDYVAQHPEVSPEKAVVVEPVVVLESPVVMSNAPTHGSVEAEVSVEPVNKWAEDEVVVPVGQNIIVAQPLVQQPGQQYLIKMTRANPLFEVRGHRFTKEHPYALLNSKDADYVLTKEEGFRQATPSELEEFYS